MTIWHCHSGEQAATKQMYLALTLIVDIFQIFQDHQDIHIEGKKIRREEKEGLFLN